MEIYRRQLVDKLEKVEPSEKNWTRVYIDHLAEIEWKMNAFFKEVDRGTQEEDFLKWNQIVVEELGIDNNKLFSPDEEKN